MKKNLSLESKAVQSPDFAQSPALCAPIVQSTTFVQQQLGDPDFAYSRVSNPTVEALEARLGELEEAPPGVCCSSGLAAETVLFLSLLRAGDHVVCGRAVYGGTTRLLQQVLEGLGVASTFVDATDSEQVAAALRPDTRLIFLETPANPTLELTDLSEVCAVARQAQVLTAVDNTFLTPVGQQPLELGVDISVYSTTKLIDGHSAALGGALLTRDPALLNRFRLIRKSIGCIQTPLNAWLTLQGLKTLPVRFQQQSQHAVELAEWLQKHPEIDAVYYPGLSHFPQRELADRQHLRGHGNVVSFELKTGYEAAVELVKSLKLCRLAEHVGSVETIVTHSASMTHVDVEPEERRAAGISDGLLRLSVGLESPVDIIEDLESGLAQLTIAGGSTKNGFVEANGVGALV